MPVNPLDLQPLLMQQQQVGAQHGIAHEQPVAQQRQLIEQVKKDNIENDHKVNQSEKEEELALREREGRAGGRGAAGHRQDNKDEAETAPPAPPPATDPCRGHHIDVKQ